VKVARAIRLLDGVAALELAAINGVEIRTDMPLPTTARRLRANELTEILEAMPVGGSFLHCSHGRAAARTLKAKGKRFVAHVGPDKEKQIPVGMWRIWRAE
jgi:hypothetical protein